MNISELSIRRPVLSTVLTIIILLFGFIGYSYLGVRQWIIPLYRYPAPTPVQMLMLLKIRSQSHWNRISTVFPVFALYRVSASRDNVVLQ